MSTVSSENILATLRQARDEMEQEYLTRRSIIDRAIAAFESDEVPETPVRRRNGTKSVEELSIGSDKLKRVQAVLHATQNGRMRQADIAKKAGHKGKPMNSGTVSVALRKLEAEGQVRSTGSKEDGSMVWEEVREETPAS